MFINNSNPIYSKNHIALCTRVSNTNNSKKIRYDGIATDLMYRNKYYTYLDIKNVNNNTDLHTKKIKFKFLNIDMNEIANRKY